MRFDTARTTELTRRSVLQTLGSGVAALGVHRLALARTPLQVRQCNPPSRLQGLSPPYIACFVYADGDELLFVAARHSADIHSRTHALIRHMLSVIAPERLIVEGYYDDPARLLPEDFALFRRRRHPETRYALALAEMQGIRAVGGDLHLSEVARASLNHGFELHDVLGTHIVRVLAGQLSTPTFSAVEESVRRQLGELFPSSGFNFQDWYRLRVGQPVSYASARRIYHGPCGSGIIAEIASFESETRNQRLVAVIEKARRDVGRVGTVFGANHLYSIFDSLAEGAVQLDILTPADLPSASPRTTVATTSSEADGTLARL